MHLRYNTDGSGAASAIKEVSNLKNKNILLIGAGGSTQSIAFHLAKEKINELKIINRTIEKAGTLVKRIKMNMPIINPEFNVDLKYGELKLTKEELKNYDILINTTSIGMYPNLVSKSIVSADIMHSGLIVNDIVYNPIKTALVKEAEKANAIIIHGTKMLVHEGGEAFKIWTGHEPPIKIMEEKILDLLKQSDV